MIQAAAAEILELGRLADWKWPGVHALAGVDPDVLALDDVRCRVALAGVPGAPDPGRAVVVDAIGLGLDDGRPRTAVDAPAVAGVAIATGMDAPLGYVETWLGDRLISDARPPAGAILAVVETGLVSARAAGIGMAAGTGPRPAHTVHCRSGSRVGEGQTAAPFDSDRFPIAAVFGFPPLHVQARSSSKHLRRMMEVQNDSARMGSREVQGQFECRSIPNARLATRLGNRSRKETRNAHRRNFHLATRRKVAAVQEDFGLTVSANGFEMAAEVTGPHEGHRSSVRRSLVETVEIRPLS